MRVALAALLLTASAACNSSSGADRGTAANTVATEPPRTTTTDPYAIPEAIDEAYVNRVLVVHLRFGFAEVLAEMPVLHA